MTGLHRTFIAAVSGASLLCVLPRAGVMAATQELIGFLSLLMAGLLPAMTLTATILRGDGISARRVDEFAGALRLQLRFWAALFIAAAIATGAISLAKVFATQGVAFSFNIGDLIFSQESFVEVSLSVAGMGVGIVVVRLYAAYEGLQSLLGFNTTMAKAEAIARDRAARDALSLEVGAIVDPKEYQGITRP